MKAERLEGEFAECAVPYEGSLLLLEPSDALALVSRAAEEGVPVVRVDGFRLDGRKARAQPEHGVDYAARVAEGHGCWQEADAFTRQRAALGLVFALTLGDDPIEAV